MINQMLMILAIVLVVDVIALDNNQQTGVVCSTDHDNLTNTIILNLLEGVGDPEDDCECSWTRQTVFVCSGLKTMVMLVVITMIMMLLSNV